MNEAIAQENRLTTMEAMLQELKRLNSDHERRIRTVERVLGYGSGAVGMALFVLKVLKVI